MDAEAELLKTMTADELEAALSAKIESFHGLLTREVALRLIAKEKGMLKEEERDYRLADIPKGARRFGFSAAVKKVWPMATYSSGKRSRVVEVVDESAGGGKPLVLWNDDVELAKSLRSKDEIRVKGAYERGGELHLGYGGMLEVTRKAAFSSLAELNDGETVHLRGAVSAIEGYDSFIRDGKKIRGFSFMLSDGRNERRCLVVDGTARAERLKVGDEALIEGANVSNGNIEIGASTRLLMRRAGEMLLGEIKELRCEDETLKADVGGREVTLGRESALRFLGVGVAGDIALATVVGLKKESLLNTRIAVKIEEKDGQILVRG
ncbi:hypothetical protein H0O00_03505 [Candidatus Micrarchaeota archaeon]|nr:hypothetical protein [Candidatus Micrarchaeota archaeon]